MNTAITDHTGSSSNPHSVTLTQALAADGTTDATVANINTLTDAGDADALHTHDGKQDADAALDEAVTFFGSTDISAAEAETLTDGSNADALHAHAIVKQTMVAGESFAANTTFAVRKAINGETDGRVYKADIDASGVDKYHVIGLVYSTGAVAAGENIVVVMLGEITSSVAFTASQDEGKEVFLAASGAVTLSAPSGNEQASFHCGSVSLVGAAGTAKIFVSALGLNGITAAA